MSRARKISLAALALVAAALAGAGLLWWGSDGSLRPSPAFARSHVTTVPSDSLARESLGETRSSAGPLASSSAARAEAAGEETRAEEEATGRVGGFVLDVLSGEPIGRSTVAFSEGTDVDDATYLAKSDEVGRYETSPIPVGAYEVSLVRMDGYGNGFSTVVGIVVVEPDVITHYDVLLQGERTLSGCFTEPGDEVPERGASPLRIELRRASDLTRLVAHGRTVTYGRKTLGRGKEPPDEWQAPEAWDEYLEERQQEQDWQDPSGRFQFTHLEPDVYVLWVLLDVVDRSAGEYYIERRVDLRDGDVLLPHEEVRVEDFGELSTEHESE